MSNRDRINLTRWESEVCLGSSDYVLSSHCCKDRAGYIYKIWVNAGIHECQRKCARCWLSCWACSHLARHCDCIGLRYRSTKAQIALIFESKQSWWRIEGFNYCCCSRKRIGVVYCAAGRVSNEGRNCVNNRVASDCVSLICHGWGSDAYRTCAGGLKFTSSLVDFWV